MRDMTGAEAEGSRLRTATEQSSSDLAQQLEQQHTSNMKGALFLLAAAIAVSATPLPDARVPTGTYGVCGGGAAFNSAHLALVLNGDGTFHYLNNLDREEHVDVRGQWKVRGRQVELQAETPKGTWRERYTLDRGNPCLRSRQGLLFSRLCLCASCR